MAVPQFAAFPAGSLVGARCSVEGVLGEGGQAVVLGCSDPKDRSARAGWRAVKMFEDMAAWRRE